MALEEDDDDYVEVAHNNFVNENKIEVKKQEKNEENSNGKWKWTHVCHDL